MIFVDRRRGTSERQPVSNIFLSVEPQWVGVKKLPWEESMTYASEGAPYISFISSEYAPPCT